MQVNPYEDEFGTVWLDGSGFKVSPNIGPGPCFMCKRLTERVDVNFDTFYCNSDECNKAIEDDLRNN